MVLAEIRAGSLTGEQLIESSERAWLKGDRGFRVEMIREMLRSDLWFWVPAVERILGLAVAEGILPQMAREVSSQMDSELASQIYWDEIIRASARSPDVAMRQLESLLNEKGSHPVFASMVLSGIFRSNPEEALSLISRLISRDDRAQRLIGLGAAMVVLKEHEEYADQLARPILSIPVPSEAEMQSVYSLCLRLIHSVDPQEVEQRFIELYKVSPPWIRAQISYDLSVIPGVSEETRRWVSG